jgi:hypothetical protein
MNAIKSRDACKNSEACNNMEEANRCRDNRRITAPTADGRPATTRRAEIEETSQQQYYY